MVFCWTVVAITECAMCRLPIALLRRARCVELNADGGKVGTGFLLVAGYLALCIFRAGPIPADAFMTRFC